MALNIRRQQYSQYDQTIENNQKNIFKKIQLNFKKLNIDVSQKRKHKIEKLTTYEPALIMIVSKKIHF